MRRVCLERPVLSYALRAEALVLDDGVQVTLTGGCRSHVGSVTLAEPDGTVRTLTEPGHRDQVLGEAWAKALALHCGCRVCVVCGIHYDAPGPEGLAAVVAQAGVLLDEMTGRL